ncbi:MAG: TasA family protein [Bacillota bacterium]
MFRLKIVLSLVAIVLTIALVGAATMAWFTAATDPIENTFTAGTVAISAGRQAGVGKIVEGNWNPGDCRELRLCVLNEGSKSTVIRARLLGRWSPGALRLLVIYTGQNIQLLAIEWDSTCKGYTGTDGPIATGDFNVAYPGTVSYINGKFRNLSNLDWLENNVIYATWCVDKNTTIGTGWHNGVQVFDPFCNEDWYDEVATQSRWEAIPWDKIEYIINQDYLSRGYAKNDIQDAIWYYTNGITVSGNAQEIVGDAEAYTYLSTDNVRLTPGAGWEPGPGGYWYHIAPVPGTFSGASEAERTICLSVNVCLDGLSTGNEYQGAQYWLSALFEAIQASHGAAQNEWGWPVE